MATARIMYFGDDMVVGQEQTTGTRSPRGRLQQRLKDANYDIDFVGSQSLAPVAGGTDPNHEGYNGLYLDTTVSATNNALVKINTVDVMGSGVGIDIVIVLLGWMDVINNTSSIGTKYGTVISAIAAKKPSAKIFMCTLPPYYNKSESETGATYPAYATLNTAIRALVGGNNYVVDLAKIASGGSASDRTAFMERLLDISKGQSDSLVGANNQAYSDPYGGMRFNSHAAIVNAMTTLANPPGNGRQTFPGSDFESDTSIEGRNWFHQNVNHIQVWVHAFPAPGHTANNTGVEIRNLCAMVFKTDNSWGEMFAGARIQGNFWNGTNFHNPQYTTPPGCTFRQQPDGITTFWRAPGGSIYSPEGWPIDRSPSTGDGKLVGTYKGVNRSLMASAAGYLVAFQARLALDNPSGTNDSASGRYLMRAGTDFQTVDPVTKERLGPKGGWTPRYDNWGFPLGALDNGGGYNKTLATTEWTTFGFISIQNQGFVGGLLRPWYAGNTYIDSVWGSSPWGPTEAQIRANPPPLPSYWTLTGTSTGWAATDYSGTTYLMAQSGADRIAQATSDAMVLSGIMSSYVVGSSGGTTPLLAEGASTSPQFVVEKTAGLYTFAAAQTAAATGPIWATEFIPDALVGQAYSATVQAGTGSTYAIVSGAPTWMTVNPTTGAITASGTGLVTGTDATFAVIFSATRAGVTLNRTFTMRVSVVATLNGQATVSVTAAGNLTTRAPAAQLSGSATIGVFANGQLNVGSSISTPTVPALTQVEYLTKAAQPPVIVDIPALPADTPLSLKRVLESMKEYIQIIAGRRGSELDTTVTFRDLITSGIGTIDLSKSARFGAPPISLPPVDSDVDFSTPPAPTSLTVLAGVGSLFLTWNGAGFTSYAYTEIWRANVNDIGQAVKIATSIAPQYADFIGSQGDRYYWVRFVSKTPVTGPFNAAAGTKGTTSPDPAYLIDVLSETYGVENVANAPFYYVATPTEINGVTVPQGTYIKSAFIANATITSAQIANLTANKITAGYINNAIGMNSAKLYGTELYSGGSVTVLMDPNGEVVGFTPVNPTFKVVDGNVDVRANLFRVTHPGNGATVQPFYVVGNRTYIDTAIIQDGSITNAYIGSFIQSNNYVPGLSGWNIDKGGTAEFNTVIARGKIIAGTGTPGGAVELGADIGPVAAGHYGITLSNTNYDNIFLRRSDGVVFFRLNSAGSNNITYDSGSGQLSIQTPNFKVNGDGSVFASGIVLSRPNVVASGIYTNPDSAQTFDPVSSDLPDAVFVVDTGYNNTEAINLATSAAFVARATVTTATYTPFISTSARIFAIRAEPTILSEVDHFNTGVSGSVPGGRIYLRIVVPKPSNIAVGVGSIRVGQISWSLLRLT